MASREVFRSPEIGCQNFLIALKFNERIGSSDTKAPVKNFERSYKSKSKSNGFEISRDLVKWHLQLSK